MSSGIGVPAGARTRDLFRYAPLLRIPAERKSGAVLRALHQMKQEIATKSLIAAALARRERRPLR
jgi:hypothetical protein